MFSQRSYSVPSTHSHFRYTITLTLVPQEESGDKISKAACGDLSNNEKEDDEEMEQEEMFVDAHESFEYQTREWGGPRRGGRLPEPTRFGDWERKGRCTDF